MKPSLDTVTNLVLIVACVLMTGIAVLNRLSPRSPPPRPTYDSGEQVAFADALRINGTGGVLLYASSTCPYCTSSMPFYKRLTEQTQRAGVTFIVAGGESEATLAQYLRDHSVVADQVISLSRPDPKLTMTPLLLLVDRAGVVQHAWQGQLSTEQEQEVFARSFK